MKRDSRPIAALLLAALLLAPAAQGQPKEKTEPEKKPSQYWIVLLDVSLSSEQRDRELSRKLQKPDYRLRNEILSLLQTSLGARREKEQGTRDDYLDVYVFGDQVKQVTQLPIHPVSWDDIQLEDWWNKVIPTRIGARTNYIHAIEEAVHTFQVKHAEARKNLVLISDGELDIGDVNRRSRGKLSREEIEAYRNFLRPDNEDLAWMNRHGVAVYTLAVDETLGGSNDAPRQQQIRSQLSQARLGDSSPLGRALQMVEKLNASAGPDGLMPESEGPYIMQALADQFAERTRGQARSVRPDNVLNTLWATVFPEETHHRILPPETSKVILFAPLDSPVQVKLRKDGKQTTVSLRHDPTTGSYLIDPAEARKDVDVQLETTSQYATWLIASPYLDEVGPSPEAKLLAEQFSLLTINNVRFVWQSGKPPEKILAGTGIELALDLVWQKDMEGPTVQEWRQALTGVPRRATGQVLGPGSGPWPVNYVTEVPQDGSETVLRLHTRFAKTEAAGSYRTGAYLEVGPEGRAWPLKALPVTFQVLAESPLSDPDRFALGLRIQRAGETGDLIAVPPPPRGQSAGPIEITTEVPARLVFEWSSEVEKGCDGVDQLQVVVLGLERTFGSSQNQLRGKPLLEGDRMICYRSAPELLPEDAYGRVLQIQASDGLASWERAFTIQAPMPLWKRALLGLGLLLLALLLAAVLAWFVSPALRERLRLWWEIRKADFPLALEPLGGERVEWQPGDPKRFVATVARDGRVQVETTDRKAGAGEQGFEVRPSSGYEYVVRPLAGPGWTLKRIPKQGQPSSPRMLGPDGETVSLIELTRGTRVEISQGNASVVLRHKAL